MFIPRCNQKDTADPLTAKGTKYSKEEGAFGPSCVLSWLNKVVSARPPSSVCVILNANSYHSLTSYTAGLIAIVWPFGSTFIFAANVGSRNAAPSTVLPVVV